MPTTKHKVFAYITHADQLLVFRHPFAPEVGIQVPAGTVEPDEAFDMAVLREAFEETGLINLQLIRLLGEQVRDMADFGRDEIHHRHFYHLRCWKATATTWRHVESNSADGSGEHVFEFFWARLPHSVPELIGDHGKLLPVLWANLGLAQLD
ncbi:NUDIX domain-containing protein [soil metagenome]